MLIRPQNSLPVDDLAARLIALQTRIRAAATAAGRNERSITLVAVSKGHDAAAVAALARLGVRDFGESYLQEALPKMDALAALDLTWHFIGRVQANKTRALAERFAWVHGIDRLRVAERLAVQRPHHAPPLNVCLQVKLAADDAKGGVGAVELPPLAAAVGALPRLKLRGLMCMLPADLGPAAQRRHFDGVGMLYQQLNDRGAGLDTLSMGMSDDFEAAIAAGATLVRIGTALFGSRPAVPST
jgi:pyridoxal phosphate enzyme (YggS family)